ncbi:hypothetical protein [Histidinibacterium aquaticum]|uniref:Secreted protein n=1 Tax=Histidinibacterium aquaticum TaxID=2613962 RepID=A0A5J5GL33_9RHOB|nr:hypothetical protein [Histidinibacterium aquaticum]KAA9008850.1 hypothetical protein F3S47_06185 [Histidinibacterium aquaticum]
MRLILLIVLSSLLALASLPQSVMADDALHVHDCAGCSEDAPGHAPVDGVGTACSKVGHCSAAMVALPPSERIADAPAAERYRLTEPTSVRSFIVPLDLPPPRA